MRIRFSYWYQPAIWLVILTIAGICGCTTTQVSDNNVEEVSYTPPQQIDLHTKMPLEKGKKIHVLSVGINKYNDPSISPTIYADNDAEAFAEIWSNSVPEQNIHLLTNNRATLSAIRQSIEYDLSRAQEDDTVYVFFAGHGDTVELADDRTTSGLLPYDAKRNQTETYYKLTELKEDLKKKVKARNLLLVLDCCHSGAAGLIRGVENVYRTVSGKKLGELVKRADYSWGVLTACRPEEKSRASLKYNNGFFTHWLTHGLAGFADQKEHGGSGDGDGVVTYKELYDFTYARVKESTRGTQHPVTSGVFFQETPMSWVVTSELPMLEDAEEAAASLKINVEPNDAKVYCDNKRLHSGKAGVNAKVKPGSHTIRISRKGYETQTGQVSLIAGESLVVVVNLKQKQIFKSDTIQSF